MKKNIALNVIIKNEVLKFNGSNLFFYFKKNKISEHEFVRAKWLNHNKNYSWVDLPDINSESTFTDCISGELRVKNNKFEIKLILWDGDSVYGNPIEERCAFYLTLDNLPEQLEPLIETKINHMVQDIIDEEKRIEELAKFQTQRLKLINALDN